MSQTMKLWEAATQRCSYKKVFWKYAANLQEDTHAEVRFQYSCNFSECPELFCKKRVYRNLEIASIMSLLEEHPE